MSDNIIPAGGTNFWGTSGSASAQELSGFSDEAIGQQQFLTLFVTSLENQDPMNPLDPHEQVAQLAQFSMVSTLAEMKETAEATLANMQLDQASQAANLIGREVYVNGTSIPFGVQSEEVIDMSVNLPADVNSLTLTITNSEGDEVRSISAGSQPVGRYDFAWDGLDNDGLPASGGPFTITANITGEGFGSTLLPVGVRSTVESVSVVPGSGALLNLTGQGSAPLAAILHIY